MSTATLVTPTIVVFVDGGLIHNIAASHPVRVVVLDADVQGNYEDKITEIDGTKVIVSDHRHVDIDAEYVVSLSKQLELAVHS